MDTGSAYSGVDQLSVVLFSGMGVWYRVGRMPDDGATGKSADLNRFPQTRWTELLLAANAGNTVAAEALDRVLQRYQPLVRTYLGFRFGVNSDKAWDLWQEFVRRKVLQDKLLADADRARGRFRGFLLASLNHFVISEFRKESAQMRSPDEPLVPLDEVAASELPAYRDPERSPADLDWVRTILLDALEKMEADCRRNNQVGVWEVFEGRFLRPILEGVPLVDYEALVRKHGFESPSQASNVLITAKRMFLRYLHLTAADYAADAESAEQELRELAKVGD